MRRVKGVLMECNGKNGVVMTPDGAFVAVRLETGRERVGEQVDLPVAKMRLQFGGRKPGWRGWTAATVAASLLLFAMAPLTKPMLGSSAEVVAYMSLDINPSVELGLDRWGWIVRWRPINEEGVKLIAQADDLSGPLQKGVKRLFNDAVEGGYIQYPENDTVLLSLIPTREDVPLPANIENKLHQASRTIQAVLDGMGGDRHISVALLRLSHPDLREGAREAGLSVGKYALWLEYQAAGTDITPMELASMPVGTALEGISRFASTDVAGLLPASNLDLVQLDRRFRADLARFDSEEATLGMTTAVDGAEQVQVVLHDMTVAGYGEGFEVESEAGENSLHAEPTNSMDTSQATEHAPSGQEEHSGQGEQAEVSVGRESPIEPRQTTPANVPIATFDRGSFSSEHRQDQQGSDTSDRGRHGEAGDDRDVRGGSKSERNEKVPNGRNAEVPKSRTPVSKSTYVPVQAEWQKGRLSGSNLKQQIERQMQYLADELLNIRSKGHSNGKGSTKNDWQEKRDQHDSKRKDPDRRNAPSSGRGGKNRRRPGDRCA